MNMSQVVSDIMHRYGLYNITMPFRDATTGQPTSVDNVVRDVIVRTTIPTYSEFVPWVRKGDCNLQNLKCVDEHSGVYMLPYFLTTTPVKYVLDVSLPYHNTRGTYGDVSPVYGINRSVQGVINSTEYMMVAGLMRAEPTFEYLGHNKIRLYGYPRVLLTFEVACEHDPNGESIEPGCYDSFMELATLDIKSFLYNNLKLFEIPSAFGNVNLKLDDFQGAEAERTALLDKWRDTFHLDITQYIEFM